MSNLALAVVLSFLAWSSVSCASSTHRAEAPSEPTRVVFQLTSGEVKTWESLLGNIENLQKAMPGVHVEAVVHGQALGMLVKDENSAVRDQLEAIAGGDVVFAACETTMRREKVQKADLVPFAVTVDAGVAQVVRRQEQGWSYVRMDG